MNRPMIGLTLSDKSAANLNSNKYIETIQAAGGDVKLIPNNSTVDELEEFRRICDGVLLSGGGDIDPLLYGQQPHHATHTINMNRDRVEFGLVHLALDSNWPILGICRGHQMLNVALGGTLFQDIPTVCASDIRHQVNDLYPAHTIQIEASTKLHQILDQDSIQVNSRHHQAIQDLASDLRVTARSSDGLIEGIELPGHPYFIGVQWHPENLQDHEEHKRIFESFIAAAAGN